MDQMKYLKELAVRYPNVAAASTEIINLQAILHLPKGTEHYVSDVHGEYEKFSHIIRNGSGAIRSRIEDEFGNTLTTKQKKMCIRDSPYGTWNRICDQSITANW